MKALGYFLVMTLMTVAGIVLIFLSFFNTNGSSLTAGSVFSARVESAMTTNKKLKESRYHYPIGSEKRRDLSNINLEDYPRTDPAPRSRPSKSGTIEHGTPLRPHIAPPAPPAPGHPKNGGSP